MRCEVARSWRGSSCEMSRVSWPAGRPPGDKRSDPLRFAIGHAGGASRSTAAGRSAYRSSAVGPDRVGRGLARAVADLESQLRLLESTVSVAPGYSRAETKEGRLLRKEDQPVWTDPQSGYVRRHVSPCSDMPLDLVRVELPPGVEIPMPASAYAFLRQLIWVLDGSLIFFEGPVRHAMEEGDCLELGPPADCMFKNESSRPCIYTVVVLSTA